MDTIKCIRTSQEYNVYKGEYGIFQKMITIGKVPHIKFCNVVGQVKTVPANVCSFVEYSVEHSVEHSVDV